MSIEWKGDRAEMEIRKNDKEMMDKARLKNFNQNIEAYKALSTDKERWEWIRDNQESGVLLSLDYDCFGVFFPHPNGNKDDGKYFTLDESSFTFDSFYPLLLAIGFNIDETEN
jgi:hypothetical protein